MVGDIFNTNSFIIFCIRTNYVLIIIEMYRVTSRADKRSNVGNLCLFFDVFCYWERLYNYFDYNGLAVGGYYDRSNVVRHRFRIVSKLNDPKIAFSVRYLSNGDFPCTRHSIIAILSVKTVFVKRVRLSVNRRPSVSCTVSRGCLLHT